MASASGALVDRNGLRPASFAVTRDRLVAVASEAGAVPFTAAETIRRGRLGPGELFLVSRAPGVMEDADAKHWVAAALAIHDAPRAVSRGRVAAAISRARGAHDHVMRTSRPRRRARPLDIKTMALEGHEPLWSMGDDTPTPGVRRLTGPIADHLRQAFAQVTNPAIDPERERIVMDLRVELGPTAGAPGGHAARTRTAAPAADRRRPRRACSPRSGRPGLRSGRSTRPGSRPGAGGRRSTSCPATPSASARRGAEVLLLTDAAWTIDRLPIPSILATARSTPR
jgi:hypothetical protein